MPLKKNQHLVPVCYLKGFLAEPTIEQSNNDNFERGVFVKNYSLNDDWKLRGLRHSVFTKSYFYNLDSDDPKRPIIENYLSCIETELKKNLREIRSGKLTNENLSFFSFYTILQYMRAENYLNSFQGVWDSIAETLDKLTGGHIEYKLAFNSLAKKQLIGTDYGDIVYDNAHILYNYTNIPFMTSDNPVVRRQVNICDMRVLLPPEYIVATEDESKEERLFFYPISPHIAYISSPLIGMGLDRKLVINELRHISSLNTASILNATEYVYSSVKPPPLVDSAISRHIKAYKHSHFYVKIYGNNKRVISILTNFEDGKNSVQLFVGDPSSIKPFGLGNELELFEVIKNGVSIRSMRQCVVASIDHKKGTMTIESKFKI